MSMSAWNIFKLEVDRPETTKVYREADRHILEMRLARRVSYLLASYGDPTDVEVDVCHSIEVADTKSFVALEVEPVDLGDNTTLYINQIPVVAGEVITDPGTHAIMLEDYNGFPVLAASVLDPSSQTEKLVEAHDGQTLPIPTLLECVDALNVVVEALYRDPYYSRNQMPYDPSTYPQVVSDPEFEALIARF